MDHTQFQDLLSSIDGLSSQQKLALKSVLSGETEAAASLAAIEARLAETRQCPHCGTPGAVSKGVDFAWWVPYFLAHCNCWMIFGTFWSHLKIPIDLRYFFQYYHMGRDSIAIQRIRTSLEFGIREL